jgi:hypothetical protein
MREMGVSRYNTVPKSRGYKYIYQCIACLKNFPTRKKLGPLACAACCKLHTQGKYDVRFKLVLAQTLNPSAQVEKVTLPEPVTELF